MPWEEHSKTKVMKLNHTNKAYIGISIVLLLLIIYTFTNNRSSDRYNYAASITVPATFPVHLKRAYFLMSNGDFEGLRSEEVENFTADWHSYDVNTNHVENQLLPEKLVLSYLSYRNKTFYSDTLTLPVEEMKMVFETAAKNEQFLVLSSYAGIKKGLAYMIGVANDGNVIMWLRGVNLEEVVFKTKLKAKEPNFDDLNDEKALTKEEYFNSVFRDLSDSVKIKLNSRYDSKANYIDTPSRYIENNKKLWSTKNRLHLP